MQSAAGQGGVPWVAGAAEFIGTIDLASPDSINTFATNFKTRYSRLDLLVNNAACNFVPEYYCASGVLGIVQVLTCLYI